MKIVFFVLCIYFASSAPPRVLSSLAGLEDSSNINRVRYQFAPEEYHLVYYDADLNVPRYFYSVTALDSRRQENGVLERDPASGEEYISVDGQYNYNILVPNFSNEVTYTADRNGYRAKFIFGTQVTTQRPQPQPQPVTPLPPQDTPTTKGIDPTLLQCAIGSGCLKK